MTNHRRLRHSQFKFTIKSSDMPTTKGSRSHQPTPIQIRLQAIVSRVTSRFNPQTISTISSLNRVLRNLPFLSSLNLTQTEVHHILCRRSAHAVHKYSLYKFTGHTAIATISGPRSVHQVNSPSTDRTIFHYHHESKR